MSDDLRPLRVNALELLRQPGATRSIATTAAGSPLDIDHDALADDVDIAVELEATNDGINVRGEIGVPWAGRCRRCLIDVTGTAIALVDERYQRPSEFGTIDDDAYEITNNQLDLAPMTRQLVLLELDDERLCRSDCAGLCPVCGIDRNDTSCACDTTVKDDRWAALDGLVLED